MYVGKIHPTIGSKKTDEQIPSAGNESQTPIQSKKKKKSTKKDEGIIDMDEVLKKIGEFEDDSLLKKSELTEMKEKVIEENGQCQLNGGEEDVTIKENDKPQCEGKKSKLKKKKLKEKVENINEIKEPSSEHINSAKKTSSHDTASEKKINPKNIEKVIIFSLLFFKFHHFFKQFFNIYFLEIK
jgi:hypothetical protein